MEEREPKGSYAESREQQAEFEEDVREEKGDWQAAVDDVVEGKEPEDPERPASSGA